MNLILSMNLFLKIGFKDFIKEFLFNFNQRMAHTYHKATFLYPDLDFELFFSEIGQKRELIPFQE